MPTPPERHEYLHQGDVELFHLGDDDHKSDSTNYEDAISVDSSVVHSSGDSTFTRPSQPKCWKIKTNNVTRQKWLIDTKNVLLVVLGLFVGLAFTAVCNPPNVFLHQFNLASQIFRVKDVIVGPKRPPLIFYYMVFNALAYIVSVGSIVVLLWQLPFAGVLLLAAIAISFVFGLAVYSNTPQFLVAIGSNYTFSSSYFVFISALALILFGLIAWLIVRFLCRICTSKATRTSPEG